jgi:1,4-alpha-glucan branching enzyme
MSLKKQFLANEICRVTFKYPKEAAKDAVSVHLVGEFNDWDIQANPMKRLRNGDFSLTLNLKSGREYQFRYFIDCLQWDNDWDADAYVPSPIGGAYNSVVAV